MDILIRIFKKPSLTLIVLLFCLMSCQKSDGNPKSDSTDKETSKVDKFNYEDLGMGIVIDRVFKLENNNLKTTFTNKDYETIKKANFKHVRVPIREKFMNEEDPGKISAQNLKVIKEVIDQILRFNLIVVFNPVHPTDKRMVERPGPS